MCGIYGIIRFKNSTFNVKLLRIVLKKLALESKIRGKDATGYAFMNKKGATVFKHNTFADEFIGLKNYKKVVRDNMPGDGKFGSPYSVIGHTRQRTLGSPTNPLNNHPIITGSIIGVHNGVISNHREVFTWLKKQPSLSAERIAQVDSEAIFALINHHSKVFKWPAKYVDANVLGHTEDPTSMAIVKASEKLKGGYACAIIDSDSPQNVWLFRAYGQLAVNYYRKEKLLIFASVESFIDKAVALYNMSIPDTLSVDAHTGMCIDTRDGTYNTFKLKECSNFQTSYMY